MTTTKTAEELAHPSQEDIELGAVLHALSDPVRLRIVRALAESACECTTGTIDVPVTKSTCTHHFRVLREAGGIRQRQAGTSGMNPVRRGDREARSPGVLPTVLQAASS